MPEAIVLNPQTSDILVPTLLFPLPARVVPILVVSKIIESLAPSPIP